MKISFEAYFDKVDKDGRATACLDFHLECPDDGFRDLIMEKIMKALHEEPEKEERQPALGFATGDGEEEEETEEEDA